MPRPNRDLELVSVYLPRAELAEIRAAAAELEAPVAHVIRAMIRMGVGMLERGELDDEPRPGSLPA